MNSIKIFDSTGAFAENKDIARDIRINIIEKNIFKDDILLDFSQVNDATQSFIHALISDTIRKNGPDILDKITFKSCNEKVSAIVSIVVEYTQDTIVD